MKIVFVFVLAGFALVLGQQDSILENNGARLALKIYEDCSKSDGLSPCLKKKAITFIDRLSRMDKFSLADGVFVNRAPDSKPTGAVSMTEEQLETTLPRAADAKNDVLNNMLLDKISNFLGSRTVEVTLPKINPADLLLVEEGRKKSGGGGGGGGKKGGMMGGMMMAIAAKMAALIPIAIAGLFLLAGKALITAKIALLISGIIALKKLFAQKQGGGGGGHGGWQSSGGGGGGHGGGGWQSGGGGGWDKRSLDDAQNLAYKAYSPK